MESGLLSADRRRHYLEAMGYQPLRLRSAQPVASATMPTASTPDPASDAREPSAAPASRPAAGGNSDPLWLALLDAAAATESDAERLGWETVLRGPAFEFDGPRLRINPIGLRGNAAAKRALWKTLRGLRRQHLRRPS